ncbi:hypothetical protein FRC04_000620 [Tulasnella sp. 424]|nr:hypothetical protein FRC04_000620 [Tulasnella sp. 424]KAG8969154.1 hypothetical protein FRC05_001198 [Tulasnella sp. 425]
MKHASNAIRHRRAPQSSRGPLRLLRRETKRNGPGPVKRLESRSTPESQKRQGGPVPAVVRNGQDPIHQLYAGGARQATTASSETSTGQRSTPADPNGDPSGEDLRAQYSSYHQIQQDNGGSDQVGPTYTASDGADAYPDGTASETAPATTEQTPSNTVNSLGPSSTAQNTSHTSSKPVDNPVLAVPERSQSQDGRPSATAAATVSVTTPSITGGGIPTTMTPASTSHQTSTSTAVLLSPGTPVTQRPTPIPPRLPTNSRASTDPIQTGLFEGDPSSTSQTSSGSSGTAIGVTAALLSIAFVVVLVYLRRRSAAAKARADRERFAELQRDFLATKESSIFGGPDRGSMSFDEKKMPTGPSWDDSFLNYLPPPSSVPHAGQQHNLGPHGRISTRGSGWMVIGEKSPALGTEAAAAEGRIPPPPNVHFADGRAPRRGFEAEVQSTSSLSTVEEAVISTASRVSAASVYTTQSTRKPPTAYKNISPYNQRHLDPAFAAAKVPVPQQHAKYSQDVSPQSGAPPNTAIGRGILKDRRGANKENISALPMAPLRINKKSNIVAPTPTKPPHMSMLSAYTEDEEDSSDPFEHDRPSGRDNNHQEPHHYHYQKRQSVYNNRSSAGFNPSQSMGELMLTPYGDDVVASDVEESPNIAAGGRSGKARDGDRGNRSEDWANHSSTAKYAAHPQQQQRQPVQPRSTTPRLTVTSPSGALSGLTPSASSSSMEEAFMSLSQMALANSQPDYRSPTYSIYNMYDGDDEAGLPRRSIPVPAARR